MANYYQDEMKIKKEIINDEETLHPEPKNKSFIRTIIQNSRQLFVFGNSVITLTVLALLIISLLMVFSGTLFDQPFDYFKRQLIAIGIGIVFYTGVRILPNKWFSNISFMNLVLLVITLIIAYTSFFGTTGGGATSWLNMGSLNFQPSEVFKVAVVLVIGRIISQTSRNFFLKRELPPKWQYSFPVAMMVVSLFLIIYQPDFGMAILIVLTAFFMAMIFLFTSRMNLMVYGVLIFLYLIGIFVSTTFAESLVASGWHPFERLGSFANPFAFARSDGFQVISGYLAFSRGGLFGVGLGRGEIKGVLPAAHTDFILAVIAEELGLMGVLLVMALLFGLIFYIFRLAASMNIRFHRVVLTGFGILLFLQTIINIGGVSGLIPLTGVTLPFLSYGGSSMIVNIMIIGIIQKFIAEEKRMRQTARQYATLQNSTGR